MLMGKIHFGGKRKIGCSNGLFVIKYLFNMQKTNNLQTFVYFVYLLRSSDTNGHELLIKVL